MTIRKWGEETVVNTTTANEQRDPVVTALTNGTYVIAWTDDKGATPDEIHFQRYNAFGVKIGTETIVASNSVGASQGKPVIAANADGFAIAWEENGGVVVKHFAADGSVRPEVLVQGSSEAPRLEPRDGGLVLTVSASDQSKLFTRLSNTLSVVSSEQITPDTNSNTGAEVTLGNNNAFATVYTTVTTDPNNFDPIHSVMFDLGLGFSGNPAAVAVERVFDTGSFGASLSDPDITHLGNGRYLVACTRNDPDITFGPTRHTVLLSIVNAPFVFSTPTVQDLSFTALGIDPVVRVLKDGGFVVIWSHEENLTDPSTLLDIQFHRELRLQLFNSSGEPVGAVATLGESGAGQQSELSVAQLADGRLVVTWQATTDAVDGSGAAILQQIIDPRDGIVEGNKDASIAETLVGHDALGDVMNGYAGNDTLFGLAGADVLYGGTGDDILNGGRGDDTLYGGFGADRLEGNLGADEFRGGADSDTVVYGSASASVTVNLLTGLGARGDAEGDTYFDVENISGSNFGDTLTLGDGGGRIDGLNGNDRLTGGTGADRLLGGNNNDVLIGRKGVDFLAGGANFDRFFFVLGDSGQTVANADKITDYQKGAVGTGDEIDFSIALSIGGSDAAATASQASINAATGRASFAAASGTSMADAINDISARFTAAGDAAGEFALFQLAGTGAHFLFVSDGTAGVTANDVLIRLDDITSIGSINLTGGDLTILT